jgi:hypothetical protein
MRVDGLFKMSLIFDSSGSDAIAWTQHTRSGRGVTITPLTKARMCAVGAANWFGEKIWC